MSYTITEPVHLTATVDGQDVSLDLEPGEATLPAHLGELLVAQGLATVTATTKTKTAKTPTEG